MQHVRWTYKSAADATETVLPDGCRDLIVISRPGMADDLRLTDLDMHPRQVHIAAGQRVTGCRLRPGARLKPGALTAFRREAVDLEQLVESETTLDGEIGDLIEALTAIDASSRRTARLAGVTPRTLQRRFRSLGLPVPDYWRLLGRARRTAGALDRTVSLADLACMHGYSDQAHMTREFVRWFGATPARLLKDKPLLDGLRQPGLGNWTAEQISIR